MSFAQSVSIFIKFIVPIFYFITHAFGVIAKNSLPPYLILYTNINSKLINGLNVRANTIKLGENIQVNYHDLQIWQ